MNNVKVTFADREYYIYDDGRIFSSFSNRFLKGKKLSPHLNYLTVDVKIDNQKKTLLLHRLVYFFFVYNPLVLKKASPSFKNFCAMPFVVHKDGIKNHNHVDNLILVLNQQALGIWSNEIFPPARRHKPKSSIQGDAALWVKKELEKNTSYTKIASVLNVSDMSVYRYAKSIGMTSKRPSGEPKLTRRQRQFILNNMHRMPQKYFAKKYKVSTTCINRFVNGKTYK